MRISRRVTIGGLICLGVVGATLSSILWEARAGWTPERVDRAVRAEVPVFAPKDSVEAWAKRHGWPYDYVDYPRERFLGVAVDSLFQLARLNPRQCFGVLKVYVLNPNVDIFTKGSLTIFFFFNKDGELLKHCVWTVIYS